MSVSSDGTLFYRKVIKQIRYIYGRIKNAGVQYRTE